MTDDYDKRMEEISKLIDKDPVKGEDALLEIEKALAEDMERIARCLGYVLYVAVRTRITSGREDVVIHF